MFMCAMQMNAKLTIMEQDLKKLQEQLDAANTQIRESECKWFQFEVKVIQMVYWILCVDHQS